MKVIPETHHSHYINYLRFSFYFTISVPDEDFSRKVLTKLDIYVVTSFSEHFPLCHNYQIYWDGGRSYNELADEGPHPMDKC